MTLGPKPLPHLIKFTTDCFEVVGFEIEYTVLRSSIHAGPFRTKNKLEAEAFAKQLNREVIETQTPITKRIKWF